MKNFQGFSRFLSPKNTNIIFYFTLVATNPFALFLSKDNNIINSLFSLVRVHYTRYNRRMMDFPERPDAKPTYYINKKLLSTENTFYSRGRGVNVFLIARYILSRERLISPLTTPSHYFSLPPSPSKEEKKKHLFHNPILDYTFAIRDRDRCYDSSFSSPTPPPTFAVR